MKPLMCAAVCFFALVYGLLCGADVATRKMEHKAKVTAEAVAANEAETATAHRAEMEAAAEEFSKKATNAYIIGLCGGETIGCRGTLRVTGSDLVVVDGHAYDDVRQTNGMPLTLNECDGVSFQTTERCVWKRDK